MIRESTYSFSLSSVSSQRTQDENFLYEASFQPRNRDPYWFGHLRKYVINADGTIGNELWDAGSVLQGASAATRNIKTLIGGSLTDFTTTNISEGNLGVATDHGTGYNRRVFPRQQPPQSGLLEIGRHLPVQPRYPRDALRLLHGCARRQRCLSGPFARRISGPPLPGIG